LQRDIERIGEIWTEGPRRFGGPFLAGAEFGAADAFYAPVAFRVQCYGLKLPACAAEYCERLLAVPAIRQWYEAALREPWRDEAHEREVVEVGEVIGDLRVPAPTP